MGMQSNRSTKHGLAEINVTPLVDVMLVLLIIFMVSAPMMQQGVPLKLPEADAPSAPPDENQIIVSVTQDRKVYIDKFEVDLAELGGKLAALREQSPQRKVFLRADEEVAYGVVVRVMAAIERAGIRDLGMLTDPESL